MEDFLNMSSDISRGEVNGYVRVGERNLQYYRKCRDENEGYEKRCSTRAGFKDMRGRGSSTEEKK